MSDFERHLNDHAAVFSRLAALEPQIERCAATLVQTLKNGGKILICGNGGSAADSQHFAAELTGHFFKERRPLAAIALTTDSSALTAIGNDYRFEDVFSRQVEALGNKGDALIGISTSGNSANVLKAFESGRRKGLHLVGLTGKAGGKMGEILAAPDELVRIDSATTSRVQEAHIFVLHYFCESIDARLA